MVGSDHPLARRRRVRMVELHNVRMVLLPAQFLTRKLLDDCFDAAGAKPHRGGAAQLGGADDRADPPDRPGGHHPRKRGGAARADLRVIPLEDPTPIRTPGMLWPKGADALAGAQALRGDHPAGGGDGGLAWGRMVAPHPGRVPSNASCSNCRIAAALQRPRVRVLVLHRDVAGAVQVRRASCRCPAAPPARRCPAPGRTPPAARCRPPSARAIRCIACRRRRRVVGQRVRQHDGVRLRVRQVEAAAQRVAQLVVQRHADRRQHRAAQPGAIQRVAARLAGRAAARAAAGRARPSARMPSSAIRSMIGLVVAEYRPSAACAMAFMPLVMLMATGRPSVSSGS